MRGTDEAAMSQRRRALATQIERACFDSSNVADCMANSMNFMMVCCFPLGASFAAVSCLEANEDEAPDSKIVGQVPKESLCSVLAHGRTPGSHRVLLEWEGGLGWVSSQGSDGEHLLHQDWPCDKYLEELREPLAIPRLDVPV